MTAERPTAAGATAPSRGRLVVISGPSGSGKTSIIERLRSDPRVCVSVSATTRPRRAHEVDGRDYHFVSREEFQRWAAEGRFIETNDVFGTGHLYGSLWSDLHAAMAADCVYIMEVDVVGAASLAAAGLEPLYVFIEPPSMEVLEERLRRRGTDDDAAVERRLARARDEMSQARAAGARIVRNESLDRAVDEVRRLVGLDRAERSDAAAARRPEGPPRSPDARPRT